MLTVIEAIFGTALRAEAEVRLSLRLTQRAIRTR